MAVDPTYFKDYEDLKVGDRVKWITKYDLSGGQGTVELVRLGIEEMCRIKLDNGDYVTVCRALGDTVEKISN